MGASLPQRSGRPRPRVGACNRGTDLRGEGHGDEQAPSRGAVPGEARRRRGRLMSGPASAGTLRRDDPVVIPAPQLPPELAPYRALLDRLGEGHPVVPERSALVDLALEVSSRPGFDVFVSLPRLRFEPFAYQLRAAEAALRRMRGRAILADEVGLGKTIEAGLVLSELRMRGMADRTLVLTPAGLVEQWREELERKFALPTSVVRTGRADPGGHELIDRPVAVASIAAARRDPLRSRLTEHAW